MIEARSDAVKSNIDRNLECQVHDVPQKQQVLFPNSMYSDSTVDHDGYSISSEGFLPAVVDIMVI